MQYQFNNFFYITIFFLLLFSCRGEDESDLQKINQVVNIYMKNSSGTDLLNTNIKGGFTTVTAQDLNADKALQAISGVSVRKDKDTIAYIDYTSGAVKILKDTGSPNSKIYQSDFYINLSKIINKATVIDTDTLKIEYNWSPTLFEVSKIYYNGKLTSITKNGSVNTISIVK